MTKYSRYTKIPTHWYHILRHAISAFSSHRCTTLAASIGFYSAFSLAPTLLMVLSIAGFFYGKDTASGEFFAQSKSLIGADAARAMQTIVESAHHTNASGMAAFLSLGLLIVGASATFTSLNTALDIVFDAEPPSGLRSITLLLRARLLSFGFTMGLGFLLVISLVLDTGIQYAEKLMFGDAPLVLAVDLLQASLGLVFLAIVFSLLIRWLPDVHVRHRDAMVGGVCAAVLFSIGRRAFSVYLVHAGTSNAYGAAGSLAVLMMWLYFSAIIFLFGAEMSASYMATRRTMKVSSPTGAPAGRE